jgi:hypothetical protein
VDEKWKMGEIDRLIDEYRAEGAYVATSAHSDKLGILELLGLHVPDTRILKLIIETIRNPSEDHNARIGAAKMLTWYPLPDESSEQAIAADLAQLLKSEVNDLVRDYVAQTARCFARFPDVAEALAVTLLDTAQPDHVRWAALDSLERGAALPVIRSVFEKLQNDLLFREVVRSRMEKNDYK